MQDRMDAGQYRGRTRKEEDSKGGKQDEGCRKGGMKERKYAGKEGCGKVVIAGNERCKIVWMQESKNVGKEGDRKGGEQDEV